MDAINWSDLSGNAIIGICLYASILNTNNRIDRLIDTVNRALNVWTKQG